MKRKLQMIFSASAASVLVCSALAQDPLNPQTKTDRPDSTRERMGEARVDRLNGATKASDVLGMEVKNYQGEKLGKVEDLAVDVESGRILQVILSIGGFIGIGDTLTAVPPGALHLDVTHKVLHLEANKEKLKSAPQFDNSKWAECCDSDHLSAVYRTYGQEPAFNFIHKGDVALDSQRNADGGRDPIASRPTAGAWEKDRMVSQKQSMIPMSRLGQIQKASKLMGLPVKNRQDEKLGKVENMLVDLPSGRIVAVIVSSGGFLMMGDELSAVPPTALRFAADRESLQLDASKEMLASAPHFKANQWPDFAEPAYAGGVYRAFNVAPYFTTDGPSTPDNARRYVRDRDERAVTPFDQGNNKSDTEITAQIRKGIMAAQDMSVNAKNVKVITSKGMVTLRGPVNTTEEKRRIAEIANDIAQPGQVDNQLEVK